MDSKWYDRVEVCGRIEFGRDSNTEQSHWEQTALEHSLDGIGRILGDLTRRISSCMRCFFVSRVEPSGFSFRVHRSLYRVSKFGLR